MWSLIGLALAAGIAVLALLRSRRPAGYYDGETYGMAPATHRRYAYTSVGFAVLFGAAYAFHNETLAIGALAVFALVAILYGASFLRGAT